MDIRSKIKALHLSWLKRLFDGNFHPWKVIPNFQFGKLCPSKCLFYPNSKLKNEKFVVFSFYENLLNLWSELSTQKPLTASSMLSECIWYNCNITIDARVVHPSFLKWNKNYTLFVADFVNLDGSLLPWETF